jgi:hypothetical protein
MDCVSPPELDDRHLWSYVDGEADHETMLHLERCEHCGEKAKALAQLQVRVKSRLYRITCPSPLELGEYHLRILPSPQVLVIAQHVRECPHCEAEVAQLESYLSDLTVPTSYLQKIKVLVAQLISQGGSDQKSGAPSMTPTLAGLRGEEDEPFIYQADNVRIMIEVQDDVEQMGLKTLLGLVTGLESNNFTIQVSQEGQVIATSSVDEIGNFMISHLEPSDYALILTGPNIEIHIQSLLVK